MARCLTNMKSSLSIISIAKGYLLQYTQLVTVTWSPIDVEVQDHRVKAPSRHDLKILCTCPRSLPLALGSISNKTWNLQGLKTKPDKGTSLIGCLKLKSLFKIAFTPFWAESRSLEPTGRGESSRKHINWHQAAECRILLEEYSLGNLIDAWQSSKTSRIEKEKV